MIVGKPRYVKVRIDDNTSAIGVYINNDPQHRIRLLTNFTPYGSDDIVDSSNVINEINRDVADINIYKYWKSQKNIKFKANPWIIGLKGEVISDKFLEDKYVFEYDASNPVNLNMVAIFAPNPAYFSGWVFYRGKIYRALYNRFINKDKLMLFNIKDKDVNVDYPIHTVYIDECRSIVEVNSGYEL